MGVEIERKFLVRGEPWRQFQASTASRLRQGYLCSDVDRVVRIRIADGRALLTIKGAQQGASRLEYEYEIPPADAAEMLDRLCLRPLVEKTRYALQYEGVPWVVDVFEGDNAGLVVAEVELDDECQVFALPAWAGKEVTAEPRFLNVNLSRHPYRQWTAAERGEAGARQ